MRWIRSSSVVLLVACSRFSASASSFSGEFEITGLRIESPFEADPKAISNTTVSFVFNDQNTPKEEPASCYLTWAVGLNPPSKRMRGTCSDQTVRAAFPSGTYNGVSDFQLEVVHTYVDNSLGPPPWNVNTLYGYLNLTYGTNGVTDGYKCEMDRAICYSEPGTMMIAKVLFATS